MSALYFLLGLSVPLATLGPELPGMIWITPSYFIGAAILGLHLLRGRINTRVMGLLLLVLIFALSSMGRHAPETYGISIAAFCVAIAPLLTGRITENSLHALLKGFLISYFFSLFLVVSWIVLQLVGMESVYEGLSPFRPVKMNIHNMFILYIRPQAGFAEPAHLAYYLAFSYAIFDNIQNPRRALLKASAMITILLTGSLVGVFLLVSYILAKAVYRPHSLLKIRVKTSVAFSSVIVFASLVIMMSMLLSLAEMLDAISRRIQVALSAFLTGHVGGSEGSRINTLSVLFEYWQDRGLYGLLFGEGYGNISAWLSGHYSMYQWSTMSAGGVDSKFVAVTLGAGVIGATFYVVFFYVVFRFFGATRSFPIVFLFVVANFASGGLLVYWKWHALFVLLALSSSLDLARFESIKLRAQTGKRSFG